MCIKYRKSAEEVLEVFGNVSGSERNKNTREWQAG